jgi:hypothetical protein
MTMPVTFLFASTRAAATGADARAIAAATIITTITTTRAHGGCG